MPAAGRPGIVDQPDPQSLGFDDGTLGKLGAKGGHVHVPAHRRHGGERPQILQDESTGEIAYVQDEIGALEQPEALVREAARASRQVRITDERDQ